MTAWPVHVVAGGAEDLHGRDALASARRRVDVMQVDGPAMVLGSTQRLDVASSDAATHDGVDIVRRRTGGGAVFLAPAQHVWLDIVVPFGDPLWDDDVSKSFTWLGQVWSRALEDVGMPGLVANTRAVCHSVLGRLICFAGSGFGELSSDHGKVLGIAQRRTREGAWFQCTVLRRWTTAPYARLLAPGLAAASDDPVVDLAAVRVHPVAASLDAIVDAVVRHLPA
jgi:lipoate-protein ligase A